MPIDWDFARRELTGELSPPSYTNGDLIYGVNNGGKFSVDVTWLAEAEATGNVHLETLHRVNDIERGADGRWIAHTDRLATDGTVVERKRIVADALFLGAGSPGTTRLLVKSKAKGLVPDLPDGVGTGWGQQRRPGLLGDHAAAQSRGRSRAVRRASGSGISATRRAR